ncbi:MAG: polysaccharide deacetylase family protein [Lentisphaerae bacterium]|nr:polysaccharide deacetylase family protein [Lentisphaerota bacterium]
MQNAVILSFDMETDIGSWTDDTRGVTEGTPEILEVLKEHDIHATFLFTGREAERHPDCVASVLEAGHEIGCHTMYHETVGRPVYSVPVGSFALEEEIESRLALATDAVERVAGVRPRSFRAPRLFGSTRMIQALEQLGYAVDSSFPCYFHGRDFVPYHPHSEDWARSGSMSLLEVPVFYDTEGNEAGDKNRARDQWPMLRLKGADWFSDLCGRMFDRARDERGISALCVYLHPWEFVDMPRVVETDESTITFRPFLYRNTGKPALRALSNFIGIMKQQGAEFATLIDLAENFNYGGLKLKRRGA